VRIGYINEFFYRLVKNRGDNMAIRKPKKYINWEEFKILDSEARFWTFISNDPENALNKMGVIA
jgi:signal peptidase I